MFSISARLWSCSFVQCPSFIGGYDLFAYAIRYTLYCTFYAPVTCTLRCSLECPISARRVESKNGLAPVLSVSSTTFFTQWPRLVIILALTKPHPVPLTGLTVLLPILPHSPPLPLLLAPTTIPAPHLVPPQYKTWCVDTLPLSAPSSATLHRITPHPFACSSGPTQ